MRILINFIIFFLIVSILDLVIFTYLHELAHKRALKRAKIESWIAWNIRGNLKHLKATSLAICYFDEKKLKNRGYKKKKDIFLSGIKSDISVILFLVILSFLSIFLIFLKINLLHLFYLQVILNTLMILRSWHLITNLFKKDSDVDKFVRFGKE